MRLLAGIFVLFFSQLHVSGNHTLTLKPKKWDVGTAGYYISMVNDDRNEKANAGQVLIEGKSQTAFFANSLPADLQALIDGSMTKDTSRFPVILSIQKLRLAETGTITKHKATLTFSYKFYSRINDKLYELFEVHGTPEMSITGSIPGIHETLIETSLKQSMESFTQWFTANRNIPPLMRKVKIMSEKGKGFDSYEKSDTILWCPNEYRLKWTDFQGTAPESPFSAQSNCMFIFSVRPELADETMTLHMQLSACFARTTSWVKPGIDSDSLLAHEQLHFDICELYIRKLRKQIMEMELDPMRYQDQFQPVFNQVWIDYQKAQNKYDEETEHGLIADQQQRWKNEVAAELIGLKEFAVSSCD